MTRNTASIVIFFATVAFWFGTTPTQAQSRVFVAAQGSDGNPCSFALPCRSFQHAHDVVASGGEIDVLDPAGYGALTITKAISIQGHGFAGLAVPSGDGITINAGAADKINLRGLLLDGIGSGQQGVVFNSGGTLAIQDCLIRNFALAGILFTPTTSSALLVSDTHVAANSLSGINVSPLSSVTLTGVIERVVSVGNGASGIRLAAGSVTATTNFIISESVVSANAGNGVTVAGAGGQITVMVWHSAIANNAVNGLSASGNTGMIRVTKSTITGNGTGIATASSGQIISFGDNSLAGNTTDGAPTSTIALQ
jgi:hypothetical protein